MRHGKEGERNEGKSNIQLLLIYQQLREQDAHIFQPGMFDARASLV